MNIYLGADHAGYELKTLVQDYLKKDGHRVVDLGVFAMEKPADYPDIALEVAEKVRENHESVGILMCGTGIGMCMAANRVKGVRAVNAESTEYAKMGRSHNNANILCLGGREIDFERAKPIIDTFLKTPFAGEERHIRRVEKMDNTRERSEDALA